MNVGNNGASATQTGLAGAEAPEPFGLGPTDGIPCAMRRVEPQEILEALVTMVAASSRVPQFREDDCCWAAYSWAVSIMDRIRQENARDGVRD